MSVACFRFQSNFQLEIFQVEIFSRTLWSGRRTCEAQARGLGDWGPAVSASAATKGGCLVPLPLDLEDQGDEALHRKLVPVGHGARRAAAYRVLD